MPTLCIWIITKITLICYKVVVKIASDKYAPKSGRILKDNGTTVNIVDLLGHPRGAQVYFDHDGFDWRGFDGDTFTDWQTCIVKNKVMDVDAIADPSTATAEDIANAYNDLLAALRG